MFWGMVAAAAIGGLGCKSQPTDYIQPQKQFEAAVDDDSTNDSFVLVTIVNGTSGVAKSGCIEASFLLGAIHAENGLDFDAHGMEQARQTALESQSHRFTFKKAAALSNVNYATLDTANREACKIIRGGRGAWRGDVGGQVLPDGE